MMAAGRLTWGGATKLKEAARRLAGEVAKVLTDHP
jgi:hypothetical protein